MPEASFALSGFLFAAALGTSVAALLSAVCVVCVLFSALSCLRLVLDSAEEDSFEALALKKGNQGGSL